MQDVYEKLEFQKIRDLIASFSHTEIGRRRILELEMIPDPHNLSHELAKLEEIIALRVQVGQLPISNSSDLEKPVVLAKKGGVLQPMDLERIANDILEADGLKRHLKPIISLRLLRELADEIPNLSLLEKDIHRVIAPDLSIFDNASPKLKGIRLGIARLENDMKKQLTSLVDSHREYLSSGNLTLRNGHYVLAVQNAYKSKVRGVVQDVSGSGNTTFIEPQALVEMNEKMMELRDAEREEIRRLLAELSAKVASFADPILLSNRILAEFDFLQCKAIYGEKIEGVVGTLRKEVGVDIKDARHPLLDPKTVVGNSFCLDENQRLLVISGPNAGGKTVALKTIAICVLMNQCALPIPAKEGATLSYFKNIFVDIGDSQSISDNLSTFSGHMKNIGEILSRTGGKDLVLLDEVGTGTSPFEGEAIAYAVILTLLRKHSIALVSSHFEGLKTYALSHPDIANASMLFDESTLSPTYRLKIGLPGKSYGLVAARRFGLPEETASIAEEYLAHHEEGSVSDAIAKLARSTQETEELRLNLEKKERQVEAERTRLEKESVVLAKKEERFHSDLDKEKARILDEYREKLQEIADELKEGDVDRKKVNAARRKLDDMEERPPEETFQGEIALGDYVNVPGLYLSGKVTKVQGERLEIVTKEGMTFKVDKNKAYRVEAPKEQSNLETSSLHFDEKVFIKSVPLELNLIGERAEEAKLHLEKYIDECLLRHHHRVRIIHGWGNGVLRRVVHEYCKAHPEFVESFEGADGNEGGGGATIVHLK